MKGRQYGSVVALYLLIIGVFISLTYLGSTVTTVVAGMIPMDRNVTIVIDAGHGGEDGGATSCSGVPESRYNLEIALRLNDLFHLMGYRTVMIRTTDRSVYTQGETIAAKKVSDLRQRAKIVNETENALLISIHQNTFSDSKYSGAQVFYAQSGEGETLAKQLQHALSQTVNPGSSRQAKPAEGIYLMKHINCTGVLVECGFLSNSQEEMKLRKSDYQQNLCCVIAATTAEFLTK